MYENATHLYIYHLGGIKLYVTRCTAGHNLDPVVSVGPQLATTATHND